MYLPASPVVKHLIKNIKDMFRMQTTSLLSQLPCPQSHSECACVYSRLPLINGSWAQRVGDFSHSHAAVEGDELDPKPADSRQGSACPIAKVSLCCWAT